jgi:hypothetical protein
MLLYVEKEPLMYRVDSLVCINVDWCMVITKGPTTNL